MYPAFRPIKAFFEKLKSPHILKVVMKGLGLDSGGYHVFADQG